MNEIERFTPEELAPKTVQRALEHWGQVTVLDGNVVTYEQPINGKLLKVRVVVTVLSGTEEPTNPLYCYHADESFQDDLGRYLVIRVDENEAGYLIRNRCATLAEAVSQAKAQNDELGLSDDDVLNIRTSSMVASQRS